MTNSPNPISPSPEERKPQPEQETTPASCPNCNAYHPKVKFCVNCKAEPPYCEGVRGNHVFCDDSWHDQEEAQTHTQGAAPATEPRRTYCHLCRSYFEGAPDGHGLGECVELCEICLQNQADIDTRDVGKTTPCAPCRRVLQLVEALRAMLDIAPFADNASTAQIHGRAEAALNDRLLGEGK